MPWLRLWTDILDDPDLHAVPRDVRSVWYDCLAICKRINPTGMTGELPPMNRLAVMLHETPPQAERYLDALVTVGLLERNGVTLKVHGWARWQAPSDRTNAARQKRHRDKTKIPPHPPEEKRREGEGEVTLRNAPVTALRNEMPPPAPPSILPWNDRQQQCVDQARDKWGASNGDVFVGELLTIYPEDIVMDSMDSYWDKHGRQFKPALLRGFCKTRFNDLLAKNGKAH